MGDPLRPLWDFRDLDASEQRLRALLDGASGPARAEALTQLARVEGLRGRFDEGERLLVEAEALAAAEPAARARVCLERGRLRRSSGDPDLALPLFEDAFDIAAGAGEEFLAVDAAHMAALAATDRAGMLAWTQRGIDVAERSSDGGVRYWLGPLLNNLGWEYYGAGEFEAGRDRPVRGREGSPRAEPAGRSRSARRARGRLGRRGRPAGRLVPRGARRGLRRARPRRRGARAGAPRSPAPARNGSVAGARRRAPRPAPRPRGRRQVMSRRSVAARPMTAKAPR